VLLPCGNHQLRLTAANETLECVVFGTMHYDMFLRLFWEAITAAQAKPSWKEGDIVVYEVGTSSEARIQLSVEDFQFEIQYLEASALVRR